VRKKSPIGRPSDEIDTDEVARLSGARPATVRYWRVRGVGPPFKRALVGRGHKVTYDRRAVIAWLQKRC